MAWFGSIYLPTSLEQDAAQQSRMVKLEVKKLKDDTIVLDKIDPDRGRKLAGAIIGSMLRHWKSIEADASAINRQRKDIITNLKSKDHSIEIRTVENFMYASALLNLVTIGVEEHEKYSVPKWALSRVEDDGNKIINTILSSVVKVDTTTYTVRDLLENANGDQRGCFGNELKKIGIALTRKGNGIKYAHNKMQNSQSLSIKGYRLRRG